MRKLAPYLLLFLCFGGYAQSGDQVFNDTIVHTLYIETGMPDWFEVLEYDYDQNSQHPDTYPQIYRSCNVTWDGIVLNNCGFREKGNASNIFTSFGKKKPLKISFDEFTNQDLDGLKKINLNNFTNDPSLVHDVIANKLFRDAGLMASRTAFTKVWIDGEFIGLYLVIENVDKTFLKLHLGGAYNDGNLYKTDRGASVFLNWLGSTPEGYKEQGLKLTTNESTDDWSKLISFIDLLNNNNSPDFKQLMENSFDVHSYLKILAIEKCIRSWDSYWGGGNNFYLYEHPDGKIRWIPWDMNESFQDVKTWSVTPLLDGYLVPTTKFAERPLLRRIFEVEEWKNEYLNEVCYLINSNFTIEHLGKYVLDRHNLMDSAYRVDPYKYNSYEAFRNSLTEENQDEVSLAESAYVLRINYPGIFPFIQSQREWAVDQMKGWDFDCSIEDNSMYNLFIYPNPASIYVNIQSENFAFDYARFRIFDFTGKECRNTGYVMVEGSYYTLSLEGLSSGIYLLMKESANGRIGRAKLIVR
jgi:spore coat protein CotH